MAGKGPPQTPGRGAVEAGFPGMWDTCGSAGTWSQQEQGKQLGCSETLGNLAVVPDKTAGLLRGWRGRAGGRSWLPTTCWTRHSHWETCSAPARSGCPRRAWTPVSFNREPGHLLPRLPVQALPMRLGAAVDGPGARAPVTHVGDVDRAPGPRLWSGHGGHLGVNQHMEDRSVFVTLLSNKQILRLALEAQLVSWAGPCVGRDTSLVLRGRGRLLLWPR